MKPRLRIEPLLVALITIVPLAGAYWLYYSGRGADLPRLVNDERRIVSPPIPLPALRAAGEAGEVDNLWARPVWSLVYARTSPCAETCREDLVHLLQVHLSLGRDQDRVQRVYLGPGEAAVAGDAGLLVGRLDSGDGGRLLERLAGAGLAPAPGAGGIYVVDPHGNVVLRYPPGAGRRGLREDLKRLLNVSRIG